MKLSKAQAFLLSRIANGEIIQRNGQGKFDTWYSTDIHGLHVNYETAKILLSCGAVEEREIRESKFYRRFQLVIPNNIDYAADSGDFDTASRITPDPAGEDMTADDGRPVDKTPWLLVHRYPPVDNNGYTVWARFFKGEEEEEEQIFGTKKDAMTWCKKKFPGVRIFYNTEFRRHAK